MKAQSVIGFILVLGTISLARAEYDELCSLFANGQKFREPDNCLAYVTCNDGVGTVTKCPDNQLYSRTDKKCVATLTDAYCDSPCKGKDAVWVSDRVTCNGYYYCRSGEAIHGSCPDGHVFDEKQQLCMFPSETDCVVVSDICGIVANDVKFLDVNNCDKYRLCTAKAGLTTASCSGTNNYYDASSGACISKYEVACGAHPIPSNICGTNAKPTKNKFVADKATCRGYYYCANMGSGISDKNPAWNQCAEGLFFDATSQSCLHPLYVSCNFNRCEGRGDMLVLAEDQYCQHYFLCKNSLPVEKIKCPRDMFFDEHKQACTYNDITYEICDY